jgi:hypothetical protein
MTDHWHETLPVLDDFSQIIDPSQYVPLPGDWCIGIADVVNSTDAIKAGHYKAVNLAGAGTISAVANELERDLNLFIFGGDGARFAVPWNSGLPQLLSRKLAPPVSMCVPCSGGRPIMFATPLSWGEASSGPKHSSRVDRSRSSRLAMMKNQISTACLASGGRSNREMERSCH